MNEFEKFVAKFQADGELNKDFRMVADGSVIITESEIETDKTFEI